MSTPIPFNALERIHEPLRSAIQEAMERVVDSGRFILGPEVSGLEAELAKYCETTHGIGVSSGTDALIAALLGLDIGPGDEVITTPFTFFATAGAIHRVGATPVFADIEDHSFNLDASCVADKITPRTRAILPVHLFGRCANLTALSEVAGDIPLIEDAAQSIGARTDEGKMAGSTGILGCFSFFPAKNLGGFGDGGAIVTRSPELDARIRSLRIHGATRRNHHEHIGGNYRLDALQAAILRVKLPALNTWSDTRRANAQHYDERLPSWVRTPELTDGHVFNQYVIRVEERDALQNWLQESGVGAGVYYPTPLHLQPCFESLGFGAGDFPVAEKAATEVLAIPIFPGLSIPEMDRVIEVIESFPRQRGNA